jgi:pimeloyl-ACP methyl ester carboxylesterase
MPTAHVNGLALAYDEVGRGANTLLLVHGHPFDRSMWRPQMEIGCRVIAPDLRGYGQSAIVPGTVMLDDFAHDLAALLDHLGVEGLVIGGLSMGGQIVMEFCRRFPERVRGVILAATSPRAETSEGKRTRNETADRLLREGVEAYAEELLPKMIAARNAPAVASHVRAMMRSAKAAGAAAALRGRAERRDYQDTLAGLDVPALVVVGDEDAFTTRADADRMHELLRSSELAWMEGVGHMPNLERPAEFNAALLRLLDRVAA